MYLNFILTVLCLILLAFLVFGVILFKKIREYLRRNKNFGQQAMFGNLFESLDAFKNVLSNTKK